MRNRGHPLTDEFHPLLPVSIAQSILSNDSAEHQERELYWAQEAGIGRVERLRHFLKGLAGFYYRIKVRKSDG